MKKYKIYLKIVYFILGALFSYISTQFRFFKINLEINVVELFLGIFTLLIGYYIAEIIQKKQVKSQNIYSFLESKLNDIWQLHSNFICLLREPRIDLNSIIGYHKDLSRKISFLSTLFKSLELNKELVPNLEGAVDQIEVFLTSQQMNENVVELEIIYPDIIKLIDNVDISLKDIFLYLNRL